MSDTQDDPLLGLLTDIAEGVAALSARVDAIEESAAAHQEQVNEALATIAEIATRTYYVSKPTSALPDDVINTSVMAAIIERWPNDAVITMSRQDRKLLNELDRQPGEIIDKLIERAQNNPDQSNASRLRMATFLALLNQERERRLKAKEQKPERDAFERER
ncbi:hypothetical protein HUO14_03725 [Parasphingorhabdus flavimaris]|uniref:Uncharacterized protein n=1 Tax=Parasphingorhabdus flavimaris TaxID=266812 RepID=A0ABX2MZX8_9SPHN|nr:hypothetical protein [Parasphingorhabdus flavimaris]NVD27017.1 hypothetical protein [Parasphingorhabdus flavimaris]